MDQKRKKNKEREGDGGQKANSPYQTSKMDAKIRGNEIYGSSGKKKKKNNNNNKSGNDTDINKCQILPRRNNSNDNG